MSKYIIEIEEGKEGVMFCQSGIVSIGLHLKDEESLRGLGISSAIPYTEPDTEQNRKEAFKNGYDAACKDIDIKSKTNAAYQKGLEDAWEAARKIVTMPNREFINSDILDLDPGESIFTKYTASEAIEKIRQYEQEQEEQIQVGDEVRNIENGWIAVVCNIDGECMTLMDTNGALGDGYHVNRFTKTGRHFPEIAAVLAKMKEDTP